MLGANDVIRYFDLQSHRRTTIATAHRAGTRIHAPVVPQYLALVLGIVAQPFLQYYVEHGTWSYTIGGVIGRLLFGVFAGALAFPGVYKAAFDADKPSFVQYCAIFAAGIGWQSVIQGGARAALGLAPT
jgi:hypothetical protein